MDQAGSKTDGFHLDAAGLQRLAYCAIFPNLLISASHELLQPINIIKLGTSSLLSQMKKANQIPPEILAEELEAINGQADRLAQAVLNLRSMAKNELKTDTSSIDVNSIIEQSHSMCRQQLENHGVETRLNLKPGLPPVQGSSGGLKFVFLSLVGNALTAFDRPDEVEHNHDDGQCKKLLEIKSFSDNAEVIIQVADTGCGIPAELDGKMFSPFTHPHSKHPCLGLFLCSVILQQMSGTIRNTSTKTPTTFEIRFAP